jgi:DNA polymerase III delta subunit
MWNGSPAGGSPRDMASTLGIKPFEADKLSRLGRGFSVEQLEGIYHSLLDTDIRMKTGRIQPALALDLLVAGLAK